MSSRKSLFQRHNFERRIQTAFGDRSLRQIAEYLECEYSSFWNWAKARTQMPLDVLALIGKETGVSLNWLLTGEGEQYTVEKKVFSDAEIAELASQQKFGGLFSVEGVVYELAQRSGKFRELLSDEGFESVLKVNKAWSETLEAFDDYEEALSGPPVQPQEVGPLEKADVMIARSLGKVGGHGEERREVKKRKKAS